MTNEQAQAILTAINEALARRENKIHASGGYLQIINNRVLVNLSVWILTDNNEGLCLSDPIVIRNVPLEFNCPILNEKTASSFWQQFLPLVPKPIVSLSIDSWIERVKDTTNWQDLLGIYYLGVKCGDQEFSLHNGDATIAHLLPQSVIKEIWDRYMK